MNSLQRRTYARARIRRWRSAELGSHELQDAYGALRISDLCRIWGTHWTVQVKHEYQRISSVQSFQP